MLKIYRYIYTYFYVYPLLVGNTHYTTLYYFKTKTLKKKLYKENGVNLQIIDILIMQTPVFFE